MPGTHQEALQAIQGMCRMHLHREDLLRRRRADDQASAATNLQRFCHVYLCRLELKQRQRAAQERFAAATLQAACRRRICQVRLLTTARSKAEEQEVARSRHAVAACHIQKCWRGRKDRHWFHEIGRDMLASLRVQRRKEAARLAAEAAIAEEASALLPQTCELLPAPSYRRKREVAAAPRGEEGDRTQDLKRTPLLFNGKAAQRRSPSRRSRRVRTWRLNPRTRWMSWAICDFLLPWAFIDVRRRRRTGALP